MAKQFPVFLNESGNLQKTSATETIDETLIQLASASNDGLMDASDKAKLDGLAADTISLVAGTAITAGLVCSINASGKAVIADKGDPTLKAEVISLYSSAAGSTKSYASPNYGTVTLGSGLTPGGAVFLGDAGAVTQSVPESAGDIVQRIGTAINTNKVLVDIESVIVIN